MHICIQCLFLILLQFDHHSSTQRIIMNTTIDPTSELASDSMVLHYLVREPKIKSGPKKAIILLHGVGSNEKDLFSLADQLPDDFLVICPRGQFTLGPGRYAWFNVDFS